jgi:hypothetical protein
VCRALPPVWAVECVHPMVVVGATRLRPPVRAPLRGRGARHGSIFRHSQDAAQRPRPSAPSLQQHRARNESRAPQSDFPLHDLVSSTAVPHAAQGLHNYTSRLMTNMPQPASTFKVRLTHGHIRKWSWNHRAVRLSCASPRHAVNPKRCRSSSGFMPSEAQICFDASMAPAVLIMRSNSRAGRARPSSRMGNNSHCLVMGFV